MFFLAACPEFRRPWSKCQTILSLHILDLRLFDALEKKAYAPKWWVPQIHKKKGKQIQEMGSHYIFRCEFGTRRGRASTSFFLGGPNSHQSSRSVWLEDSGYRKTEKMIRLLVLIWVLLGMISAPLLLGFILCHYEDHWSPTCTMNLIWVDVLSSYANKWSIGLDPQVLTSNLATWQAGPPKLQPFCWAMRLVVGHEAYSFLEKCRR